MTLCSMPRARAILAKRRAMLQLLARCVSNTEQRSLRVRATAAVLALAGEYHARALLLSHREDEGYEGFEDEKGDGVGEIGRAKEEGGGRKEEGGRGDVDGAARSRGAEKEVE
eukprot:199878-Rhodomonas_salina.2